MGAIAKGEITLSPVNDAYTVLLTPASCTINADFNGDNPRLANASGQISVKRGPVEVPFTATPFAYSGSDIAVTVVGNHFKLDRISTRDLSGWIDFRIEVNDGFNYVTTCRFTFAVVRETTMLDWILDWENNKTKIGDSYIMTPKMFIGRKEDVAETIEVEDSDSYTEETRWIEGALTGVYIGPDLLSSGENSAGIYGYFQNHEIFHLNAEGGMIGGWDIANGGIQTADGKLRILSEGTIISQEDSTTHWALYADGSATFANGNVTFQPNGNASFKGSITASTGSIGGWKIEEVGLYNGPVLIDATNRYIGIASNANWNSSPTGHETTPNATLHRTWVQDTGGVAMFWESGSDYGLIAYSATGKVVQLGSTNTIAGWTIATDAIYLGEKNNSQGGFTTDGVTIGTNGLRGKTWNIDTNGHASFANEKVVFNADGTASISGWLINTTRFSTDHAALVSSSMFSGLFITPADISDVGDTSLVSMVNNNGGIYIYSDSANSLMRSKDKDGNTCFFLSTTGYNTIGPWSFDNQSIYNGSTTVDENGFVSQHSVLLSTLGLRGYKWKLLADGSGAIAGGNIRWSADGTVTFAEGVTLNWANISGAIGNKLTKIDANGIYTGSISNEGKWALNENGSGYIAARNIEWDENGNLNLDGMLTNGNKWALKQDGSGYLASKNIYWNADGTLYVARGYIGGWELSNTSLGAVATIGTDSDGYPQVVSNNYGLALYNDFICFNHSDGRQAILGTWDSFGQPMLVRLINNRASSYDLGPKIGIYFDISNSTFNQNYAFCGKGNGVLSGVIDGYAFSKIALSSANTIYNGFMNATIANRFLIKATVNDTGVVLPTISQVRNLIGAGTSTPFCVRITIISDIESNNWTLYGRTTQKVNVNGTSREEYNSESYPVMVHWDGGVWESKSFSKGDSMEMMLIYDPSNTITLNGWATKYTARIINYHN